MQTMRYKKSASAYDKITRHLGQTRNTAVAQWSANDIKSLLHFRLNAHRVRVTELQGPSRLIY